MAENPPDSQNQPEELVIEESVSVEVAKSTENDETLALQTVSKKQATKGQMTRIQENDLLLSIYDALSAYRRPSSKPSLTRKLEAIDATLSLLNKLRSQLTTADNPLSSETPNSTHNSGLPAANPSSSIVAIGAKSNKSKTKNKPAFKPPKTPFEVFLLSGSIKLLTQDPTLKKASIRIKFESEWAKMTIEQREVWVARFIAASATTSSKITEDPKYQPVTTDFEGLDESRRPIKAELASKNPPLNYSVPTVISPCSWRLSLNPKADIIPSMQKSLQSIQLVTTLTKQTGLLLSASLSFDGTALALSDEHWIHIYNINTSPSEKEAPMTNLLFKFSIPISRGSQLSNLICLSNDGKKLYTANRGSFIQLWDVETATLEVESFGHEMPISFIGLSKNGKKVVSCASDRHIMIWDADTLTPIHRLGANGDKRLGPRSEVVCASFDPSGNYIACGSSDKVIRIWYIGAGASSGLLSTVLTGHTELISSIVWKSENEIVSTSFDNDIRLWRIHLMERSNDEDGENSPLLLSDMFDSISINSGAPIISGYIECTENQLVYTGGKDKLLKIWEISSTVSSPTPDGSSSVDHNNKGNNPIAMLLGFSQPVLHISGTSKTTSSPMFLTLTATSCRLWKYAT